MAETTNPLPLPPFKWPTDPKQIETLADEVIAESAANLDAIAKVSDEDLSTETVLYPLICAKNYKTNPKVCQSKFLQHCSTNADIRAAAADAGKKFADFKNVARGRKDVYDRVIAFKNSPKAAALTPYENHFLEAIIRDFERGGLALPEEKQSELKDLLKQDAAVCSKYSQNLTSDKTAILFTPEDLQGCPQSFIDSRKKAGSVEITLKYPDIIPIMHSCEVEETRRRMLIARETACDENLALVVEGIHLRKKIATILGYKSWAHFVTETRMSESPENVAQFVADIQEKAMPGAKADLEDLRTLKQEILKENGLDATSEVTVNPWDTSYLHQQRLKRSYGVDQEKVREYFPLDHVVEVTLQIYQELLGLRFEEIQSFDSWHDQVRLFAVFDNDNGELMGHFYLDLHPREGKYGHAAIFHLLKRTEGQVPVDCMLCNLPAPGEDGVSALLLHSNVVTFFHEFGHIMHGLCAEGIGNSTRLAKCPRDFVEAPSQMLENWCWQPNVLRRLSRHYKTSEPLPEALQQSLIAAKNVHEGFFMMRQIYLGSLDMFIHGENPPSSEAELQTKVDEMRLKLSLTQNPEGCNMLRNFGHLMNQYSAAYYGYLWAEVLSADMFAQRFEADCFDKKAGMDYRKKVLAPGGVGNINDHLTEFLGRKPERTAFLRSRGILKE